jgi:hypothetical protein
MNKIENDLAYFVDNHKASLEQILNAQNKNIMQLRHELDKK